MTQLLLLSAFSVGAPPPTYDKVIRPIFQAKCVRCHGEKERGGMLDLRTVESMLKGGNTGAAIEPGNSHKSLLVELIKFNEMPPKKEKPRVTQEELKLIRDWIDALPPAAKK